MLTAETGTAADRLRLWREFRQGLDYIDDKDDFIRLVANFFSQTPFGSRTIDYYTPESWPTPWEILHNETFCPSTISLMMYYTLTMVDTHDVDVSLWLIDDGEDRFVVPVIDNQFILNYELGQISTLQNLNNVDVIEKFKTEQIAHYA